MSSVVRYTETRPASDLCRYVRCYWRLESPSAGRAERIVPDGCPEIVFNLGDPFLRTRECGRGREQDVCLVVGQLRTSIFIEPSGRVDLFGVRLEPAGLRAVFGCPARELTDVDAPLGDVCAGVRDRLVDAVRLPPHGDRVARVERLLRDLIAAHRGAVSSGHALAVEAARRLERMSSPTVGALSESLRVSGRSIERAFAGEIGIGPKEYIRIRRLQRVIRAIQGARSRPDWAWLSASCGYCDQSHLVRDFGLIAGITPGGYLREHSAISGAFAGV